jgi:catechol 2,3-dioxygenase-like lactoylglutathione lyase family enzyme
MGSVVGTQLVAQVGFIVKDIETTKRKWAEFLGVEVPPTIGAGDYAVTKTTYKGQPAPEASCLMAFFDTGSGLQLELIEPNEAPSTWRDFLETHGEGVHHLAFKVEDTARAVADSEKFGAVFTQQGQYGDAGGQYTYLDATKDLKVFIELLESYK